MGQLINNMQGGIAANPANFSPQNTQLWEWIVGDEAPDEDTISVDHGVATMSGYLKNHDALWDAVAFFVGMSQVNPLNSAKLDRWLPATHPRWPMFRCTTVSVKGVKFNGLGQERGQFLPLGAYALPLPKYERYRFDVHFEQPQFNYTDNGGVNNEWERYLTVDPSDETEIITVDGGAFKYNAPSDASLNNSLVTINGPYLKAYAQRTGLVVTAYQIPADFIMNQYSVSPHFLAAKGRVNSTTFLGLPLQTMLFTHWEAPKRAQPVATNALNSLLFGVNVKMYFSHTDPDRAEATETRRGWNLVPSIRGMGSKWYGVYNRYDTTQNLYPEYDMNKLLQLWST